MLNRSAAGVLSGGRCADCFTSLSFDGIAREVLNRRFWMGKRWRTSFNGWRIVSPDAVFGAAF